MRRSTVWSATWGFMAAWVVWAAFTGRAVLALGLWFISNAPLIWGQQARERGL